MIGIKRNFLEKYFTKKSDKNQCTAWVNFDGTDGTIRDSYNVSSVTRVASGIYDIVFATAMANANYSVASFAVDISTADDSNLPIVGQRTDTVNYSTTQFRVYVASASQSFLDAEVVTLNIFGGK